MMNFLGQPIELVQESSGWVGIWWHSGGYRIELGFFLTATSAWEAVADLIQRDFAVRSLLEVVEDWCEIGRISEHEYAASSEALVQSVLV